MKQRLIEVDYDPETEEWTVYSRPSPELDWVSTEAGPGELMTVLGIAHDHVTGG